MLKLPDGKLTSRLRERNGERKIGYFFVVNWDHPNPDTYLDEGTHAKCVFDPSSRLEVGGLIEIGMHPPQLTDQRCLAYPDIPHFMTQHYDRVVVGSWSSDPDDFHADERPRDGLVYCPETAYHFIGRPLLETLKGKGFTGLVVSKVTQEKGEYASEWLADDDIVMIDGACSPFSPMMIVPEEANLCEYCGYAPLFCPECGKAKLNDWDFSSVCPKCDKIWQLGTQATESEKQKMRIQEADPSPGSCVNLSQWDGSDFNTGMLVTRRVVNLLERLKCGSFRAEPVAVDVTGEQWQRLEASREPC